MTLPKGLTLAPFTLLPRDSSLIISCKGHHLTILFHKESISAHLTQESGVEIGKKYLGRIEIRLKDLEELETYIARLVLPNLSKVKVEVLNRKGYILTYDKKQRAERILRRHSHIRRQKIRPDLPAIAKRFSDTQNIEAMLYYPRILYATETRRDTPIMATTPFRKRKSPPLTLAYFPFPGNEGWYSFRKEDFMGPLEREIFPFFKDVFGDFGKLVAEKMDLEKSLEEAFKGLE